MRILHLSNHCNKANGHVNVSVDLACTQARAGHSVGYCCADGDFLNLLRGAGVRLYRVEEPHRNFKNFFRANWQLMAAIRDFRPDVLHSHMAAQTVLVQPYRLLGYNFVTTLHNEFDRSAWIMGLATKVITVSQSGYKSMRKRGLPSKRLHIVENGSIGSPRLPNDVLPANLAHPAIVTVCGMHPRKGIVDLLHAFHQVHKAYPAAHLYLVGEGPMLDEYKRLADQLGLTNSVNFVGYCDDPRRYLYAADIFVLASHADPGPLVIAEARHAGLPIVATNVDGIPAMLDHGRAGILVSPHQPDAIAKALEGLLGEPNLLQKYADRSRRGSDRFSVSRVSNDMEKIYATL